MKTLDRYLAVIYVAASGVFLVTLLALFILVDFATRADRFFSIQGLHLGSFLIEYYALHIPLMLLFLLPMVNIFGTVFTLLHLGKSNELVPVVTSGRSLRRAALPFFIGAILCSGTVFWLDEWIVPPLMKRIGEMSAIPGSKTGASWSVVAVRDGERLFARKVDFVEKRLWNVRITWSRKDNSRKALLMATHGSWTDEGIWSFTSGSYQEFDENGEIVYERKEGERPVLKIERFGEEPFQVRMEMQTGDLADSSSFSLSSRTLEDILRKIEDNPDVPDFRLQYHTKFAFPLSSIVLLLLGVPFVVAVGTRGMIRGLALCLLVSMSYYVVHFSCAELAYSRNLPPVFAAWLPTLLGGSIGTILFFRMKT